MTSTSNRNRFIGASDDLLITYVTELNDNDVLMGRGSPSTGYEGNLRFRQLVRERRADYLRSDRRKEKQKIAEEIIETVLQRGGRFLQRITTLEEAEKLRVPPRTQAWRIIPPSTALYIKVKQLMRDVGPETEQKRRERREESRKQQKQETGEKTGKKDRKHPAASRGSGARREIQVRSSQAADMQKRRQAVPSGVNSNRAQIGASVPNVTNAEIRANTANTTMPGPTRPDDPRSSNSSNSIPEPQTPVDLARQLLTALQRTQQPQSHHQQLQQQQQQHPQVNLSDLLRSLGGGGVPPLVLPPAQNSNNNNHNNNNASSLARLQPAPTPAALQNSLPELLRRLGQNNPNLTLPPPQQQQQQHSSIAPVPSVNYNDSSSSSAQQQRGTSAVPQHSLQTQTSASQPQTSNLLGTLQQQHVDPSQQSAALLNINRSMQDLNNVDQDLLVLLLNVNVRR